MRHEPRRLLCWISLAASMIAARAVHAKPDPILALRDGITSGRIPVLAQPMNRDPKRVSFRPVDLPASVQSTGGEYAWAFSVEVPEGRGRLFWIFLYPRDAECVSSWYVIPVDEARRGYASHHDDGKENEEYGVRLRLAGAVNGIGGKHDKLVIQMLATNALDENQKYWVVVARKHSGQLRASVSFNYIGSQLIPSVDENKFEWHALVPKLDHTDGGGCFGE